MLRLSPAATPSNLSAEPDSVTGVAKTRPQYRCSECHHVTAKWVGRCPDCGTWGTVDEVAVLTALGGSAQRSVLPAAPAVPISSIDPGGVRHYPTGVSELDRVLGGRRRTRFGDAAGRRSRRGQVDAAAGGRAPLGAVGTTRAVSVG